MDTVYTVIGMVIVMAISFVIVIIGLMLLWTHVVTSVMYVHMLLTTFRHYPDIDPPKFINPYKPFWVTRAYFHVLVRPHKVFNLWGRVTRHKDCLWTFDCRPEWVPNIIYQWK